MALKIRMAMNVALALCGVVPLAAQQSELSAVPAVSAVEGAVEIDAAALPADSPAASETTATGDAFVQTSAATPAPAYTALNLKQKYIYSINEIFSISPLLAVAANAALDQADVRPAVWGKSPESFAIRTASHFGDLLLRHNIEFGVRALDHEDPRYFRSGQGNGWRRAGYAFVHTFAVRSDSGGVMPAYSLLVTDYGMPFLVRQWNPQRLRPLSGIEAGTLAVGIGLGTNLFNEFWPDMKKRLPRAFTRGLLGRFLDNP